MLCLPAGVSLVLKGLESVRIGPLGSFKFVCCNHVLYCLLLLQTSDKPMCVDGTSLSPVLVSTAWRSTCCHTARRGSTSATSAPKLLTGSPTWYVTKCRTTAGSTTSVKTVPRYSEFVGCLELLVLPDVREHGSGDAQGRDAGGCRASAMLQMVSEGFTLLFYIYVSFLPFLIWKWLWNLNWVLMQDAEHPRAQGSAPCKDWWGVRGPPRGKTPRGNAGRMGPQAVRQPSGPETSGHCCNINQNKK